MVMVYLIFALSIFFVRLLQDMIAVIKKENIFPSKILF